MRLKPVEEQVVALMGASSGIGRETALRFAKRGAKVVASARNEEGLNSLVEEIRAEGGEATAVVADTSEFEQVKAVTDRAVEEYGRLDTWVHLAAVGLFATFEQTTPKEFERVMDVNLMGQVYGAMAVLPQLEREHPQLKARERWREFGSPVGALRGLLPPAMLGGQEPVMAPIPGVGEQNEKILAELGYEDVETSALGPDGATSAKEA